VAVDKGVAGKFRLIAALKLAMFAAANIARLTAGGLKFYGSTKARTKRPGVF
jgi:hypothetical protein